MAYPLSLFNLISNKLWNLIPCIKNSGENILHAAYICKITSLFQNPGFFSWSGRVLPPAASSAAVPGRFPELKATEEKVRAEMKFEEQAKELLVLQEENDRLRNEIKALQEYKEKAHRELCRVRDEQKTFGKIKVNTEL